MASYKSFIGQITSAACPHHCNVRRQLNKHFCLTVL